MLNLPLLSVGAVGFVSVVGHVVTPELRALLDAYVSGDVQKATEIHQKLLPVFTGMFRTQGVITTKAALALQGLPAGPLRAPPGRALARGDRAAQDRSRRRRGTALTPDFAPERADQTSQLNKQATGLRPHRQLLVHECHARHVPERYVARVVRRVF